MAQCDTCGNEYHNTFTVTTKSKVGTFDSFECAIHSMAEKCTNCGCTILGHGVGAGGDIFCCVHCASHSDDPAKTVPVSTDESPEGSQSDVVSDPALADQMGADWSDEGGATTEGPATAERAN